eukprot:Platyproteum_vivax@DN7485_c0_g1_i2.p1
MDALMDVDKHECTWHNDNPLVQMGYLSEPDQRNDYIIYRQGTQDSVTSSWLPCKLSLLDAECVFKKPDEIVSDHYGIWTHFSVLPADSTYGPAKTQSKPKSKQRAKGTTVGVASRRRMESP